MRTRSESFRVGVVGPRHDDPHARNALFDVGRRFLGYGERDVLFGHLVSPGAEVAGVLSAVPGVDHDGHGRFRRRMEGTAREQDQRDGRKDSRLVARTTCLTDP